MEMLASDFMPRARLLPAKDLVILSDLLFEDKFADSLQSDGHGFGLGLCLKCLFLSSIFLPLNIAALHAALLNAKATCSFYKSGC